VNRPQLSKLRQVLGWLLVILAGACFFVPALFGAKAVILSDSYANWRLLVAAGIGFVLVAISSRLLRDSSLIWQLPLHSLAVSTAGTGAVVLVNAAFDNWCTVLSKTGLLACLSIAVGFATGWVMRRLQLRLLSRQDA